MIINVGSIGEHFFKIGMTRRIEPLDRVRELGDASIPFPFDIHALLFVEAAPSLENTLPSTSELILRKVSFENMIKKFFRDSIEEIRDQSYKIHQEEGVQTDLRFTLAGRRSKAVPAQ